MAIQHISVHHVRSFDFFTADLHANVTLILGNNGTGKTTLLESLYLLGRGTSFRGRDRDIITHGKQLAEIKLVDDSGSSRRTRLTLTGETFIKEFSVEDKKSARLPTKHRLPVVLFEPDELRLLSSSPQRRRDFFDGILARLYPHYQTVLSRYNRVLLQRNELLKQGNLMSPATWESHLFAWDIKFAELATEITNARHDFIELATARMPQLYSMLAGSAHTVAASYSSPRHVSYQQQLLHRLERFRVQDADRGFTSTGPHREDILISLDTHPVSETASRGEMRTIMLAFKLLEVALAEELTGKRPLILMDDVFSELDVSREIQLMHALESYQTIITATDLRDELKINASIVSL